MNSYIRGEIYSYDKLEFLVIELFLYVEFNLIWLDGSDIVQTVTPNIKDELVSNIFVGEF